MNSHTDYLWFNTKTKREYINITQEIEKIVNESRIEEGFCLVSAMHITASIYVNDAEPGLIQDIDDFLEDLAPEDGDYRHNQMSDPNGDAHLKRLTIGHQVVLPITEGELDLGPWEQVHYAEFDGQRQKRVVVKIIGE
ncbi:secondary thiamine-phosphate synthase enzyme YjbQ [Pseudomonadota bacterium]